MEFFGDYHIHTTYSDGRSTLDAVVNAAKNKGLKEIGISDHSFSTMSYGLNQKTFFKQKNQIKKYTGIKIYHGIEANILDYNGSIDVPDDVLKQVDFISIAYHRYVKFKAKKCCKEFININGWGSLENRKKLIEKNTEAYVNAIKKNPVDIVSHLNFRALVNVKTVLEAIKEKDIYLELNESHVFALKNNVQDILDSGVKLIVCSDAHGKKNVGKTTNIEKFILENNIPKDRVYGLEKTPEFKVKNGI